MANHVQKSLEININQNYWEKRGDSSYYVIAFGRERYTKILTINLVGNLYDGYFHWIYVFKYTTDWGPPSHDVPLSAVN